MYDTNIIDDRLKCKLVYIVFTIICYKWLIFKELQQMLNARTLLLMINLTGAMTAILAYRAPVTLGFYGRAGVLAERYEV